MNAILNFKTNSKQYTEISKYLKTDHSFPRLMLDEKNCHILNLLQKNCRMSLTKIAQHVNLSVDSVKKRISAMIKQDIFHPRIQLRPRNFGYKHIVDVKIKLHNTTAQSQQEFISYLTNHPRVAELFTISGEWDVSLVFISKDNRDLSMVKQEIRNRFGTIINEWSESITLQAHKFEEYDLLKLQNVQNNKEESEGKNA